MADAAPHAVGRHVDTVLDRVAIGGAAVKGAGIGEAGNRAVEPGSEVGKTMGRDFAVASGDFRLVRRIDLETGGAFENVMTIDGRHRGQIIQARIPNLDRRQYRDSRNP